MTLIFKNSNSRIELEETQKVNDFIKEMGYEIVAQDNQYLSYDVKEPLEVLEEMLKRGIV